MWDEDNRPLQPIAPMSGMFRPDTTSAAHTEAEAILAPRMGWDLPIFRGEVAVNRLGTAAGFRLLAPAAILASPEPRFDLVQFSSYCNFGNLVRQLRNGFSVARRYGARRVEFPGPHPLLSGSRVDRFDIDWRLSWRPPAQQQQPGIIGAFLYIHGLGIAPSAPEQADVILSSVRPLISSALRTPDPRVEDDDVAVHFRGGDIFRADGKVHHDYGQPPLSYYLAAIERESPRRVWLVHEDRSNPCVDEVERALRSSGIDVIPQSGTLLDDLRVLLTARRIVASTGTLVPGVATLSTRLRRLTMFYRPITTLRLLGITFIEARDLRRDFRDAVWSRNWRASREQRALILSYPREAIAFTEHAPIG